ncbi:MAG TPA: aminopeptidase [Burkholderiales bacterium]|jgi:predicted aminopeptidase
MRLALALLIAVPLSGCESVGFYAQAIGGQLGVMRAARPLDSWLTDPETTPQLRERLETARGMREFASRELSLPENGSYTSYADLRRPYVVWNVFAAPRFSVEAKRECFPFTGCVSYRGFFSEGLARRHAERLRAQGYDVYVGGVPAYSTLGWFDDPLLSTFIRYPDVQLARLLFHELAHQVVYARGDTTFNESFAVAVEEEGVRRWLRAEGRMGELAAFRAAQARKREIAAAVAETRMRLASVYASEISEDEKQARKAQEFARLRAQHGNFIPTEPNNAFLVSVAVYTQLVPAFERLLAEQGGDLPKFYARVRELAASERSIRDPLLAQRP